MAKLTIADLDFGPPSYKDMIQPTVKKNYGKWDYHTEVKPGVIKHVGNSGDTLYTVRVGIPKFMDVSTMNNLLDIADKYCEGYIRFTSRFNASLMVPNEADVDKAIKECQKMGLPVGGTGHSLKAIIHCPGWTHCHTAATDSPSITKILYEELYDYFVSNDKLPERVKMAVSGCLNMCGATHASDIAIIGVHTVVPDVLDDIISKACSVQDLIKACPKYAIKPKRGNPKSIDIDEPKCMYCGICYSVCPGAPIHRPDNDGVSVWVGGKASMTKEGNLLARLVIPYIPNDPPKWTKVVKVVKNIIDTYKKNAREDERLGEWIERIGWPMFYKLSGIPFHHASIDDYIFSVETYQHGINFKM